jgi:hypothetical protein
MRGVGQLLQHALPRCGITRALGVERRGPRLDRGLLGAPQAMGPRRPVRGDLGQAKTLHGRCVGECASISDKI